MANGNRFLVAMGANLGASLAQNAQTLRAAMAVLAAEPGLRILRASRLYATPAFPAGSGPEFANACLEVEAGLDPEGMLALLHGVEEQFGRKRTNRWGARTLDLDLLAMGDAVRPDDVTLARWMALPLADQARLAPEHLILPHPRLQERGFVLVPLAEIAPGWVHPVLGESVASLLAGLGPAALSGICPIAD